MLFSTYSSDYLAPNCSKQPIAVNTQNWYCFSLSNLIADINKYIPNRQVFASNNEKENCIRTKNNTSKISVFLLKAFIYFFNLRENHKKNILPLHITIRAVNCWFIGTETSNNKNTEYIYRLLNKHFKKDQCPIKDVI